MHTIDRDVILAIAGASCTDPRTVRRVLAGGTAKGMAYERIRRVMRERGLVYRSAAAISSSPISKAG